VAGEEWQFAGVALASALGGSGVVGLFSGGVELSRRARLRRAIDKSLELLSRLEARSDEASALRHAARLDTLRLAALSVVSLPTVIGRALGLFTAVIAVYVVVFWVVLSSLPNGPDDLLGGRGNVVAAIVALTLIYFGALAALIDQRLRQRRTHYVFAVDEGMDERVAAAAYGFSRRELSDSVVERYKRISEDQAPFAHLTASQKNSVSNRRMPRRSRWRGGAKRP
jgi:hypothetical protein